MCKFYSIIHKEPGGGYSAEVPVLPGCYTDGDSIDDVKKNLKEAIQLYLEVSDSAVMDKDLPEGAQLLEVAL